MTTEPESTVTIVEVEGNALHRQYAGQNKAQSCYVSLDCANGRLTAEYDSEIGNAVPFVVYHGREQRWNIPALTEEAANGLLEEIVPFAERVIAGYERVWNGNDYVGQFSEDAEQAMEAIYDICDRATADADEHSTVQVWDASEWFGGLGNAAAQCAALKITAETTDDELRAIENAAEADAADNGVDALNGVRCHMEWLREKAIDAAD